MFVFKKNSYVAMLIAKYAFRDCLLSLVCLVVISVSFAGCGCLFGSFTGVCQAARLLAFLLCTGLLYNGRNGLLKWTRKSLCDVMPRHLFTLLRVLNAGRSVVLVVVSCLTVCTADSVVPGVSGTVFALWGVAKYECCSLLIIIAVGMLAGLVCALILVFWAAGGGIVRFYLQEEGKPAIGDLKHTINGKTGVKVNSYIPDFNKVVDVAEGYFSITPGNDLLIAGSGKPGSVIVVIPKESVDSVDFTTLAGWKTKVYYHDGEWQRV